MVPPPPEVVPVPPPQLRIIAEKSNTARDDVVRIMLMPPGSFALDRDVPSPDSPSIQYAATASLWESGRLSSADGSKLVAVGPGYIYTSARLVP
jgi:hypothetical protein